MFVLIMNAVSSSEVALTTREICCALNNKPKDYCLNIDGNGGRCIWWYRRPRHESQRIRLVKPTLELYPYLRLLVEKGLLKRWEGYLPDRLSKWGYDRHVLYYVSEDQLEKRLAKELGKPLLHMVTSRG